MKTTIPDEEMGSRKGAKAQRKKKNQGARRLQLAPWPGAGLRPFAPLRLCVRNSPAPSAPESVHETHERTRKSEFLFVRFRAFRGPLLRPFFFFFFVIFFSAAALRAADGPNPAEQKLRESVRALTLQLRAAENEKATLLATQADAEAKATAATEQLEAMKKQMATDKNAAELEKATLNAQIAEKDAAFNQSQKTLGEWKKAHADVTGQFKKAVEIGNAKETERAKLAARVIVLDRQVADQQRKNAAMHQLGTEILSRYEKFGLGDVITRKEPFIGTTRVKFENLIQDFSDGLADQKIKP